MLHLGNVPAGTTLYVPFNTFDANGASVTISGLAVTDIEIYKNGSITQRASDAGYTLLDTDGIDFDGLTGIHGFAVDLNDNTDAGFYSVGGFYWVVVSAITVDSQTVSFVAATFRIVAAESSVGTPKADVSHWLGTAAATPTVAGVPEVDVTHFAGSAATAASGRPEVNTTHAAGTAWGSGAITSAAIATGAIDADAIADNAIDAGAIAADAITAAKIATGAIDADAIASDAVTKLRSIVSGTADSGSTTTMVDAARTEGDADYWLGAVILFTSGNLNGQARLITDFDQTTDTFTFAPALTQAVSTHTYELLPASRIDLDALAAAVWAYTTRLLTAGTNIALAKGTGVTGFNDLSAAQVNAEVVDALATDTYAEPGQGAPAATTSLAAKINYLFKAWRNRHTQTASQYSLYDDAGATIDQKATVADDGTTASRAEIVSGP